MSHPHATVVPLQGLFDHPVGGRNVRLITRAKHGSTVQLGACWLEPGEKTLAWLTQGEGDREKDDFFYGETHEVHYIITGRLRILWNEGEEGEGSCEAGPTDSVYLPPGWRYQVENIGDVPAFFVLALTPPKT